MSILLQSPKRPRSPWQRLYGWAHRGRYLWYRRHSHKLPRPVISIGNLHWGGAGKTPLVAAVAAHLRDQGLAVTVLSRGYGGSGTGVRVVSQGDGPLLGPGLAGDEPVLLAGELPGVAIVVGPDRYRAGLQALERLEPVPQIFILDDGFSHLKLQRDLDLLAFPASDPLGGGRLVPGGRLREPLASASRAHGALLTGSDGEASAGQRLAAALRPYGFAGEGFAATLQVESARLLPDQGLPPRSKVLLVSAIARPERFRATAEKAGFAVVDEVRFGDHHAYPAASLERIRRAFATSGAEAVLTTTKDRVKLHGRLDLPLAELPVRAAPEAAFWSWLDAQVERLLAR
jgi:tetraacyldisaccharide 4'-kinase